MEFRTQSQGLGLILFRKFKIRLEEFDAAVLMSDLLDVVDHGEPSAVRRRAVLCVGQGVR